MATLSHLLALPDLGLRLVQAGSGDPELSWVTITELLSLSDYLDGGEIIMTTGLSLAADDPRWLDFVAGLSRAQVAAIGFGVGVNHERIPPPLKQAASTYRVALFEIPLPVPFIAVSKAVAGLLRADELRAAHTALQIQRRILDGAHGEQKPVEVLASIAQATGRQLALIAGPGPDGDLGAGSVLASTAGFTGSAHTDTLPLDTEGALVLAVEGEEPLTPEGSSVITAGAMVLGLGLRSDRASERVERERWELLTRRILDGQLQPEAAEVLAPGIALPDTVRVIAVQGAPEQLGAWRREPKPNIARFITAVEEVPGGLARAWQLADGSEPEWMLERISRYGLDAIVGREAPLADARLSLRSAEARLGDFPGLASLYAEPHEPRTIWADRDAPFLEAALSAGATALSRQVLGPLSRFAGSRDEPGEARVSDTERESLRSTLREVFISDGQRGPAAAALGIHRNTLRDRIARLEKLTGRSLASPDDRAELWFALRSEDLGA